MELQELRQKLSEAGFSEEVEAKIDEILEKAIANGSLSEEDRTKMMELIEIDIEAGNLEVDALENMSLMLDSFVGEAESIDKSEDEEEESIYAKADEEAGDIEDELAQIQSDEMPAEAVPPVVVPEAPVATETPVEAVPQWNQPAAEPMTPPVAPASEAPVVAPWNQTVTETTTTTTPVTPTTEPTPFPGNPTGQV